MVLVRLLLAALATVTLFVVVPAAPAFACSCAGGDTSTYAGWADVVLTGTVTDHDAPVGLIRSSTDPATYTVEVDRVYAGTATATTEVRSAVSGASCGLENVEVGERYVVFADLQRDGELWASLCGGTAPAGDRLVAEVEDLLGPGGRPTPGARPDDDGGWSWLGSLFRVLEGLLLV